MTTMIVGEEEGITTNRTTVSEHFIFLIVYGHTTTEITIACVYLVIASFGNLVTICKILYEPRLHTPTFAVIGYLALADFFSVIAFTLFFFTTLVKLVKSFAICLYALSVNSSSHVVLLSIVRYFITIYPLQSRRHLTINKISLTSLLIMFISILFAVGTYYIYETNDTHRYVINCLLVTIEMVIVCSILISLHVKKLKVIHNSPSATEQTERRMNAVFTTIIIFFLIFKTCTFILTVYWYLVFHKLVSHDLNTYLPLQSIVTLTGCINYSCNPYILFLSPIVH